VSDHKGITIEKALKECLVEWGISRILTITVDNATANDKDLDWLKLQTMFDEETISRNEFMHVRCSAHVLNIIVQRGLKNTHNSIGRIQILVRYVKSFPKDYKGLSLVQIDKRLLVIPPSFLMFPLDGTQPIPCWR
jgi:hypothetical protein